ncbi:HPr kinase/phosphorylase [Ornithinibacillus gellani]|uniref:HPr(Ser) kinase/phosphatase n=1 Tax=Ornithinibacillus gellani TaxID=2293253 RepID=UPI000F473108|nr:HPr(Ser) kinase/phosphatase [Ornithinibacillus gellani]TQS74192.1 HPr kinase/phosphorylase [Ornithinibacillus gellani]
MNTISVETLVKQFRLDVLASEEYLQRRIVKAQAHQPGLELIDYFDFFPKEHVQVFGQNEVQYLHMLSDDERDLRIGNLMKYNPPCIIVTNQLGGLKYLRKYCTAYQIPLLRTTESTYEFMGKLDSFMIKMLAQEMAIHGVCINVSGIGILLRGKSGVGKSETAHTLIRRGHRLVADDIVVLKKLSPQTLLGTHNGKNKELLAMRSIGLLNVVYQYGIKAFQDETRIALDIELVEWKKKDLNNELEVADKHTTYMDVQVPHIQIQLQPGRDVAGLIEAAATSWYLKQQGYNAAEDFLQRIQTELGDPDCEDE